MFDRDGALRGWPQAHQRSAVGIRGAGGNNLPVDRNYVAKLLSFPHFKNSIDAVSDRDFIEFLSASAILFVHLSCLAEELVLWCSQSSDSSNCRMGTAREAP
jgi:argininosuccinate lyase